MKKSIIGLVAIVGMLLLSGCVYDPHSRYVSFGNGKPYSTPYGTIYKISNPTLRNQTGVNCPNGYAFWIEKRLFKTLRTKNRSQVRATIRKAMRDAYAGCVPPLNNREYQFMLNQQNQSAANARAANVSSAIMAPKTYNVNHTGTVYHY